MTQNRQYDLPQGQVGLHGRVEHPAPGTLPLRGDLAHIALAQEHLSAFYAIPILCTIAQQDAPLQLIAQDDAEILTSLETGSVFEALDFAGDWCWGCVGPTGPSGYIRKTSLNIP